MRPSGLLFLCLLIPLSVSHSCAAPQNRHNHNTELIIAFSGEDDGYLEPCGCEKGQIGGIARRYSLLSSIRQGGLTLLPLSLGDLTGHWKRQDEIKMETLVEALGEMQYVLHNLGEKDLGMGAEMLGYAFYTGPVKLLSSNILLPDAPGVKIYPYVIIDAAAGDERIRIGILGILSPGLLDTVPHGVTVTPPSEAVARLLREVEGLRDADLLVLISHADLDESVRLAGLFPEFQLVISGHGIDHPVITDTGGAIVAACGSKGKYVGLFHYNPGGEKPRVEMIALDESYADSGRMLDLLADYEQRLKDENLLAQVEKFTDAEGRTYVGSAVCGVCHRAVFLHWETTGHAPAYETLIRVGHDYDPECVACHVTGLYYESGFTLPGETPELKGVGCEACHGAGSRHVEAARKGVKAGGYGRMEPDDCEACHDIEHSSQFEYGDYWRRIAHPKEPSGG